MKCATHPDRDATAFCRTCGKPLCPECTRDVRGILYCEACLAAMVAAVPPAAPVGVPNPGVAAALGFIPGLGAIYNGEYVKGLIHVAVFAGIVAILNSQPSDSLQAFFVVGLICFIFYMPIEAYRTAKMKQAVAYAGYGRHPAGTTGGAAAAPAEGAAPGAPVTGPTAASFAGAPGVPAPVPQVQQGPLHGSMSGAVILIALGVLILLANLGLLSSEWFGHWWPVILIGLGVWLIWKRYHEPTGKAGQQP